MTNNSNPQGWKECKLGGIAVFQRGHDLPKTEMNVGVIPVAGSNGVIGYHNKATTKGPGITIGRSGNIGTPKFYTSDFWAHNTVLYVKDFKGNDEKFLFYFLHIFDFSGFNAGSAVPTLNRNHIHEIPVIIPPFPEQCAIAGVLSSLDDKIDLLHRQNKTLEAMAEALWRKMFVEEAEEKNDNGKLGDVVASANTGLDAIKRAPIVEKDTGIKCLRIQDVSQSKTFDRWGFTEVSEQNFEKFQLRKDDIIMARTCSPGINYFVREDLKAVFNNGLVRIRADKSKVYPIFLYCLFKTREFIGHIDGISGGTSVQLNMQVGELLDYNFSFPSLAYQEKILGQFVSIDNKIFKNHKQIHTLSRLRDTLIPKLMSGEVRVNA